jgi:hypothetical protein
MVIGRLWGLRYVHSLAKEDRPEVFHRAIFATVTDYVSPQAAADVI